jgi:Tfp pilus assembly protein PilF
MWFFRQENGYSVSQILRNAIPFVCVFFFFIIIRKNVLTQDDHAEMMMVNDSVLAAGTNYAPNADKWATHFGIFFKYISLLFYPVGLTYDYSFNQIPCLAWSDFKAIFSLFFHLGLIAASIWGLMKKQTWAFGIIFYLATFSIVSNTIIPIAATMAERFLFAPSLGFCIAIVVGLHTLLKKSEAIPVIPILAGLFGIVTLLYSFIVVERNPVWENNKTLFASGVLTSPNSFRTHFNLAETLRVEGEKTDKAKEGEKRKKLLLDAAKYYENSLRIYPEYTLAWQNLGMSYGNADQPEKAREAYEKGLKILPKTATDASYANIANNLGSYYSTYAKDYAKAVQYFELSHKYNPYNSNINAVVNLGIVNTLMANDMSKAGQDGKPLYQKASDWYEKAITINNNQAQKPWLESLVQLNMILGNTAKAQQYQRTLGAGPSK